MVVHKSQKVWPQKVWPLALGLLTALLWTSQFAANWFVPHSDIRIAELDKIELASVIQTERAESSRESRPESKSDTVASDSGLFAVHAIRSDRRPSTFTSENAQRKLTVALPGIRAPPHYFLSA